MINGLRDPLQSFSVCLLFNRIEVLHSSAALRDAGILLDACVSIIERSSLRNTRIPSTRTMRSWKSMYFAFQERHKNSMQETRQIQIKVADNHVDLFVLPARN